ncbi:Num1 protein [Martiniozyma asiatica (nom. inval.)]|nr:Num1 protein [Martiniozyma asiatica]
MSDQSSQSRISSSDLKLQLGELQRRFSPGNIRGSRSTEEPPIRLPPTVSRKQSNNSMIQHRNSAAKTVDFLGDLSDGLLLESRKLTYENKHYKEQLSKLQSEFNTLKNQHENLATVFEAANAKEEQLNDLNWELEIKVQQLTQSLSKSNTELESLKGVHSTSLSSKDELKSKVDSLQSQLKKLEESSNSIVNNLKIELAETKENNNNLNDENDQLHQNCINLKSQINEIKNDRDELKLAYDKALEDSFHDFDDSLIQDPITLPLVEEINKFDTETLQRNLSHAYSIIKKLRSQNLKMKSPRSKRSPMSPSNVSAIGNNDQSWINNSFADNDKVILNLNNIPALSKSDDDQSDSDFDYIQDRSIDHLSSSSPVTNRILNLDIDDDDEKLDPHQVVIIVPKFVNDVPITIEDIHVNLSNFQTIDLDNHQFSTLMNNSETIHNNNHKNSNSFQLITDTELKKLTIDTNKSISIDKHDELVNELNSSKMLLESKLSELELELNNANNQFELKINEKDEVISQLHSKLNFTLDQLASVKLEVERLSDLSKSEKENHDAFISLKESEMVDLRNSLDATSSELEQLKSNYHAPNVDYIVEKSKYLGMIAIPADNHDTLLNNVKQLTILQSQLNDQKDKLKLKQSEVDDIQIQLDDAHSQLNININEINKLNSRLDMPDVEYIKAKSALHNIVPVPVAEHESMKSHIDELETKIESPNVEYIKAKSALHNIVPVPVAEHESMKSHIDELETKIESPDVEYIKAKSALHNIVPVPVAEHESMKSHIDELETKIESPDVEYIKAKSALHNIVPVPVAEHESMKSHIDELETKIESPDVEYIKAKSALHNIVPVPVAEHESMKSHIDELETKLESPDVEYIKAKSALHNIVPVPVAEHESMKSHIDELETKIESPDVEYIKAKSALHNIVPVPVAEHESMKSHIDELETKLESPNVEYIKAKSALHNIVPVPVAEHESMKSHIDELETKLESPNVEYIKAKSALHNIVPVPVAEHESMKSHIDELETKIESPDVEYIKAKSALHNIVPVPVAEHESMKSHIDELETKIESPDVEYIKAKSALHNIVPVPVAEHQTLKEEHSKLQKVVHERDIKLNELLLKIESPDIDYIKSKSNLHGIVPVPIDMHSSMKAEMDSISTELEQKTLALGELKLKCDDLDQQLTEKRGKIVDMEMELVNFENLKSELASKTIEFEQLVELKVNLESKLEQCTTELLTVNYKYSTQNEELAELKEKIDRPGADYLKSKGRQYALAVHPQSETEELLRLIDDGQFALADCSLQIAELKEQIKLKDEEIKEFSTLIENPDIAYIEQHSARHGLVVVPIKENELLKDELKNTKCELLDPSLDYIKLHSSKKNHILIPVDQHNELQTSVNKPSQEYLKNKSLLYGLVTVPMADHISLNKKIEDQAEKITQLKATIENPDVEYIKDKSSNINMVLLTKDRFNDLNALESELALNKTKLAEKETQLKDICEKLTIRTTEFDELKNKLDKPSIDYIKSKSEIYSLATLPQSELDNLNLQIKDKELEIKRQGDDIAALRRIKEDLELQGEKSVSMHLHDSVQSELVKTKEETQMIISKLEISKNNLSFKDAQLAELKVDANGLSQRLNEAEAELNDVKTSEMTLRSNNDELRNRIAELEVNLENPDSNYIESKSANHGLVVLSIADHESLKTDAASLVTVELELASTFGKLEDAELQNATLETKLNELISVKEQLESTCAELDVKQKKVMELEQLIENPSLEYVASKSSIHDHVAIPVEKYDLIQKDMKLLQDLKRDLENANSKEALLNSKIQKLEQKESEFIRLRSIIETPDIEYLQSKAKLHGMTAVYIADLESNKFEINSLKDKLDQRELELLELKKCVSELDDVKTEKETLIEQLNQFKTLEDELKSTSNELHAKGKELEAVKVLYDEPSIDYLKVKSTKNGLVVLPLAEVESMNGKIMTLNDQLVSKDSLISKLDLQVKTLETPTTEYIHTRSTAMGFIPIPMFEHDSMKSELNDKKAKLKANEKLIIELTDAKNELDNKLLKSNEVVSDLQMKLTQIEKDSQKLSDSKKVLKSHNNNLIDNLEASNKQITSLETELEVSLSTVDKHKKSIDELNGHKNDLTTELEEHKTKLVDIESEKVALNKELEEHKKSIDELNGHKNDLTTELEEHKTKLVDIESEKVALNKELEEHKKSIDELNGHKNDLTTELEEHKTKLVDIESEKVALNKELEEHKKSIDELNGHKNDLTTELEEHKTKLVDIESEKVALNKELEEHKKSIDELNGHKNDLTTELEEHKTKLVDIESEKVALNKELEEHKKSIDELNGHKNDLTTELEEHKTKLVDIESEKVALNKELEEHKKSIDELNGHKNDLTTELEEHKTKLDDIESEKERLVSDLDEQKQVIADLQETADKLIVLENDVTVLNNQLNEKNTVIESLNKKLNEPSVEFLSSKAASLGLITIPAFEQKTMSTQLSEFKNQIEILEKSNSEISIALKDKNLKFSSLETEILNKSDEIDRLNVLNEDLRKQMEITQHTNDDTDEETDEETDEKLEKKALSRGFMLLPMLKQDLLTAYGMQKSSSAATVTNTIDNSDHLPEKTLEIIITTLTNSGFKTLSIEEYEELKNLAATKSHEEEYEISNMSIEADHLKEQLEAKKERLNLLSRRSSVVSTTSTSSTISVDDILQIKQQSIEKKKAELMEKIASLKNERDIAQKQINRLSSASYGSTNKKLDSRLDKKMTKLDDELELAYIELNSQNNALDAVNAYIESAKEMSFAPVPSSLTNSKQNDEITTLKKDIVNLETKYNEKVEELAHLQGTFKELSETEMIEKLSGSGFTISKKSSSVYSDGSLLPTKSTLSVTPSVTGSEYFDAQSYFTNDGTSEEKKLREKANALGLAVVSISDFQKYHTETLKNPQSIESLTTLQLMAEKMGYELIKADQLNELTNSTAMPEELNRVDLQMYANKLELKLLSTEDITQLKKRAVTSKELALKAAELNLVLMSEKEVNDLKMKEPVTDNNLKQVAKKLGLMCIPESQFIATTVSRTPDIANVVVLPQSYYRKLLRSNEFFKKNRNTVDTIQPAIPEDQPYSPYDPARSLDNVSNLEVTSLHTVNTVISNKQEIIAAVTQTIIGEYLFKYYRKLGPLTAISDTRHERYFWIHPYSLTLYWSTHNPVLTDPAKNNIKAISIQGVKSVDDNNPLPPGLYHKSIIVKSYDKNVKITCPTRQRHNIWLNSLRYLLEKSTENWVNDDSTEDQYLENSISRKELERTQSMAFRHSQPRSVSYKSLNNKRVSSMASMRSSMRN